MATYVAFLRAINVGSRNKISKAQQQLLFEQHDCRNVKVFLNTGNIRFDYEGNINKLQEATQKDLEVMLEPPMPVIIRTLEHLQQLVKRHPFGDGEPAVMETWYVTLMEASYDLDLPFDKSLSVGDFHYLKDYENTIYSVVNRKKGGAAPNATLEKKTNVLGTSRNWNTILKLLA